MLRARCDRLSRWRLTQRAPVPLISGDAPASLVTGTIVRHKPAQPFHRNYPWPLRRVPSNHPWPLLRMSSQGQFKTRCCHHSIITPVYSNVPALCVWQSRWAVSCKNLHQQCLPLPCWVVGWKEQHLPLVVVGCRRMARRHPDSVLPVGKYPAAKRLTWEQQHCSQAATPRPSQIRLVKNITITFCIYTSGTLSSCSP